MDIVLLIIEIIGFISFSMSGALISIDKETDLFGVIFLSIITCFGGGLIRDVIIGEMPVMFNSLYFEVLLTTLTAITVFVLAKIFKRQYVEQEKTVIRINNYADALALGIFCVAGVQTCIEKCPDDGMFLAVTMGMITAVGGGMIRDLMLRDIPFVLRKRIYAVAALLGSVIYYVIVVFAMPNSDAGQLVGTIACVVFVCTLRLLATHFKLNMPKAIIFSEIDNGEKDS